MQIKCFNKDLNLKKQGSVVKVMDRNIYDIICDKLKRNPLINWTVYLEIITNDSRNSWKWY